LSDDERQFLTELLQHELKEKRIEERRTAFNSFRDVVVQQEHVIESLLGKLGQPAAV
jgi:hypothetical protein